MMKKIMRAIMMITAAFVMTVGCPASAYAQEKVTEIQAVQIMNVLQKVDAKAKPDNNAETVFSYDADSLAFVTGETDNGWYIVYYQGNTGYINIQSSQDMLEVADMNIEALDEELEALQVRDKIIVEEVERYRAEVRRSKIWGTIIVLLVVGIFAVGIVSTVRAERKKKEEEGPGKSVEEKENIVKRRIEKRQKKGQKKDKKQNIIDLDKE